MNVVRNPVAQILDLNPRRMSPNDSAHIPIDLRPYAGDWRQYPLRIGALLPDSVQWYFEGQPWYFMDIAWDPALYEKAGNKDMLIISGSGLSMKLFADAERSAFTTNELYGLAMAKELILDYLANGKPVLGICAGGQLAVQTAGGKLGRLPNNGDAHTIVEAGWLEHYKTAPAEYDPVFRYLPRCFWGAHLHSDFIEALPYVGQVLQTRHGAVTVADSLILAYRNGYLDTDGLAAKNTRYAHATMVRFTNGASIHTIQPHPEMSVDNQAAGFLVRRNPWLEDVMGGGYYHNAQMVDVQDFSLGKLIGSFAQYAVAKREQDLGVTFSTERVTPGIELFAPYLLP